MTQIETTCRKKSRVINLLELRSLVRRKVCRKLKTVSLLNQRNASRVGAYGEHSAQDSERSNR
jgi:hypothetical protein